MQGAGTILENGLHVVVVLFRLIGFDERMEILDHGPGYRVHLSVPAVAVMTGIIELQVGRGCFGGVLGIGNRGGIGRLVTSQAFDGDLAEADAFDLRGRAVKATLHEVGTEADGFEDLRALVAVEDRDAHLRHDLENALLEARMVALQGFADGNSTELVLGIVLDHFAHAFVGQVGTDGSAAESDQAGHLVGFARLAGVDDDAGQHALAAPGEVVMHGTCREQCGHGDALVVGGAVTENEQPGAVVDGCLGLGAESLDGGFESLGTVTSRPGHVQRFGREVVGDGLQRFELMGKQEGRLEMDDPGMLLGLGEQVALRSDIGLDRHDQVLTDRVDWRVGDLGEQLLEVRVEKLRLQRQDRQGGVIAHRVDGLLCVAHQGGNGHVHFFLVVAEGDLLLRQAEDVEIIGWSGGSRVDFLDKADALALHPLAVGLAGGELFLDFAVMGHRTFFEVDDDDFAGGETAFFYDGGIVDKGSADFGSEREQAIVGDLVASRPQAVAVKTGGDRFAVGECQRGRAIPGLREAAVILVEVFHLRAGERIDAPRRGNQHGHGVFQGATGENQQFEGVVEAGGVRGARIDEILQQLHVVAPDLAFELADPGIEPVAVAAKGIDLAVVGEHAERLRQAPGRKGVRAEALMVEADRRGVVGTLQVEVELLQCRGDEEGLVGNQTMGERTDVKAGNIFLLGFQFDLATAEIESAFEGISVLDSLGTLEQEMQDLRLGGSSLIAKLAGIDRHVAPADDFNASVSNHALGNDFRLHVIRMVLGWQKEYSHRELLGVFHRASEPLYLGEQNVIRQLGGDTGTVAGFHVRFLGTAMNDVAHRRDTVLENAIVAHTVDVCHHAYATGVALQFRSMQAVGLYRERRVGNRGCA